MSNRPQLSLEESPTESVIPALLRRIGRDREQGAKMLGLSVDHLNAYVYETRSVSLEAVACLTALYLVFLHESGLMQAELNEEKA